MSLAWSVASFALIFSLDSSLQGPLTTASIQKTLNEMRILLLVSALMSNWGLFHGFSRWYDSWVWPYLQSNSATHVLWCFNGRIWYGKWLYLFGIITLLRQNIARSCPRSCEWTIQGHRAKTRSFGLDKWQRSGSIVHLWNLVWSNSIWLRGWAT